ncbi:hypothetical protein [Kitasatospora sp. HPMI-4]|uniref:hypothetical protein n=1 Tax=Kitasatospora sp. HPMI-4 TaxID=3448443 RepID=UPI003F1BC320
MRKRNGGAVASGALLLAVLASLVGQSGPVYAAEARPAAVGSPQPGADASPAAGGPAAGKPNGASKGGPGQVAPKASPKMDPKADHDAAVRALGQSDPAGACPASLEPQTVVKCAVDPYQTVSLSLTLPQQKDLVLLQAVSTKGWIYPALVAPDGTKVTCENPLGTGYGYGVVRCPTSQAGTYSLQVRDGTGMQNGISVSYVPVLSSTLCRTVAAADRTLGAPTVFHGSLPVASAGDCYTPDLGADDVLRSYTSAYQVVQTVYDATGKALCDSQRDSSNGLDCKLAGTAPFRVVVQQPSGAAQNYDFTAARLSQPEGCAVVEPQAFGASPDLTPTARCRTLRVPEAARYTFGPVASGTAPSGGLFKTDGTAQTANCSSGACDLTPGDYTWVVEARNTAAGAFGMAFHSAKETRGCTATGDSGLAAGPVSGTFGGPGQQLCLTLPTAAGNGVYLLNRPPTDGTGVAVEVDDASGTKQCDNGGYSYAVCKLTGTAPFRAVLSGTASKAYQLVVHRTGETAGCTGWPQSAFGGSWGAEVSLTQAAQQACLSLPGDRHSIAEMLDYTNLKNQVNAAIHVVDPSGTEACVTGGSSTTTCVLAAGVPYTAMLVGTGWADTYKLVRRDISPTSSCTAAASTTVGGHSTPLDLTSALDARCIRVSGATTDKFWLSARTPGTRYDPSTLLMAVDADGKVLCWQWGVSCRVTGSTSYVAVVVASGYNGKAIHTNVDTWKVGTADGWAPECTAHRISVDGFPLQSGVLTESSTAYCAVVDMKPSQAFDVVGTSSATGVETPNLSLMGGSTWNDPNLTFQCNGAYGTFGARCQATGNAEAGQAVLLLSAGKTATPVEYSMQGLCATGCTRAPAPVPTGISPSTGAAGTQTQAVVRGTGLTLGTKVKLVRSDVWSSTQPVMSPLSVSPDGSSLNVLVDTNGLEPGVYDVVLDGIGYTSGVPSPGYLPKAYTVTAAGTTAKSRFVPITPSRFLDTRYGVGAEKARVGQGGVVRLQVAGVKGVPATGVSAVVMNVTAVSPSQAGSVSVYPDGRPVPGVSSLSFPAGQAVANLVTVPVVDGKVDLRNALGSVHLVADVTGYYSDAATGSALTPITPSRFLDTRYGVGAEKARVGQGGVVRLQVAGVKGVPATGVSAVVMNVTAVSPSQAGSVSVYPDGRPVPGVSSLSFPAGQAVANLVTVPVVDGKVDLRNNLGSVHLVADVTGYYSATGSAFSPAASVRLLDTRDGVGARAGAVGPGGVVSVKVAGVEGVPMTGVTAVVLNVTATAPTHDGYLTVYPHGGQRPGISSFNYTAGRTVAHQVVVPVVDGRVTIYNHVGDADVVADLIGCFTA